MLMTKRYILECLDKYCDFSGPLHRENFEECVVIPLQENHCFEDWSWDNGVSKGVLIFSGLQFVVKIPFTGWAEWNCSEYRDPDGCWCNWSDAHTSSGGMRTDFYKREGYEDYCEFACADCGEDGECSWDYCAVEQLRYNAAKEVGLEDIFAKTELIGLVGDNYPVYIQERCCMFEIEYCSTNKEKYKKRTKKDYEKVNELRKKLDFYSINDNWMLDFLIYFGEEMMERFAQFCFDWNIHDLHDGNIGYHGGVPCLVDYSSYDD